MIEVSYEKLVSTGDAGIRRLISDCGLPWEDSVLDFYKLTRPVFTASQLQVRRPIYRGAIARWRNYAAQLQPLLDLLGKSGD
jgi:hypothetical protein